MTAIADGADFDCGFTDDLFCRAHAQVTLAQRHAAGAAAVDGSPSVFERRCVANRQILHL